MSNETQPQPSPAAMLAGVLRVVAPKWEWESFSLDRFAHGFTDSEKDYQQLDPTSKDDLARVVAMLTPEQRSKLSMLLNEAWMVCGAKDRGEPFAAWLLLADTKTILAAIVAAVGLGAGGE